MPFINEVLNANKETIAQSSQTPAQRVSRFTFDPEKVIQSISRQIIGQSEAVTAVGDFLHLIKADIGNTQRPLAVFFFAGSTGTGKTETVNLLAKELLGDPGAICRIDMNTLSQEHYAASLAGAPPGYAGSKENFTLLDSEKIQGSYSRPGIVLFDEIEKASKEVIRVLLGVLDTGHLRLSGSTKSIDFRNSLIFMTSNLGAQEVSTYQNRFLSGWRALLRKKPDEKDENELQKRAVEQSFDPEFLNRIDRILYFKKLTTDSLGGILDLELSKLNQRLQKKYEAHLSLDQSAREFLLSEFDERYGARFLARKVRVNLEPIIAQALWNHPNQHSFIAEHAQERLRVIIAEPVCMVSEKLQRGYESGLT